MKPRLRHVAGAALCALAIHGAMIRRAAPMPPFPEELPEARLRLVVPITFEMR